MRRVLLRALPGRAPDARPAGDALPAGRARGGRGARSGAGEGPLTTNAKDALELAGDGGGTRLRLRVSAGASRSKILGVHGGALKLSVKAPPEKGKANREVLALVAKTFGVTLKDVEILSGETSPDKVVRLSIPEEEAALRAAGFPRK